jgi:UDP-N-acetyl-D-glucosamine dehydrogenase
MVADALNERERAVKGSRILALGVAYKPNVADTRDSPALEIIETLARKGARVAYHDPHVASVAVGGTRMDAVAWPVDLAAWDAVLVLTPHATYDWASIVAGARLVIDTRNATGALPPAPHVIRL